MPTPLELARDHGERRKRLAKATAGHGIALWRQVDPGNLTVSWLRMVGRLMARVESAQLQAAAEAEAYTRAVLQAQGAVVEPEGQLVPEALAGIASDGRNLLSALWNPVVAAKTAIRKGANLDRAMATGQASLEMLVRTQVSDAGRVADGVALATRSSIGYVRMLVPPGDCSRCIILAGRIYRYNAGFERHPQCNCAHIPTRGEEAARSEGLVSDPKERFEQMSEAEQNRIFTKDGAQAIRDGADMNQVVNARRGAAGLAPAGARITAEERRAIGSGRLRTTNVYGQEVFLTTEGTTRRGIAGKRLIARAGEMQTTDARTVTRISREGRVQRTVTRNRAQIPRLMPESIYQLATSREDAIRLLKLYGYII
ncbi:VG15 protein [Amycolatopsis dendrobii]|uniref:MuF-like minor capsid protein n=1 Tax=Amycolatopsis dendrobii TaxID=2760662 RepID=A0A7W3ZA98_9PSEU|nr:hypothetical protein [Amycolatopsis dendrobii]MBB1153990.1 hypothetical protein [Amycolatopsis dendrobii]